EDRLCGLDHALDLERALGKPELRLQRLEGGNQRRHLLRRGDLRQRDEEAGRELAAQIRQEDVERAQRSRRELAAQRLDPDPDEGTERAGLQPLGAFLSGLGGVAVLLGVAADSVAVLEIDAEVLHRFALQLLLDPRVDDLGDAGIDPDRLRESGGVRRVLRERLEREVSELLRGVALEQVRATVDGVYGLAGPGLARIVARERILLRLQARADLAEGLLGEGGLRHGPCLSTLPQRGIPLGRRSGVRRTVPWPFQAAFSGQSRARDICKVP